MDDILYCIKCDEWSFWPANTPIVYKNDYHTCPGITYIQNGSESLPYNIVLHGELSIFKLKRSELFNRVRENSFKDDDIDVVVTSINSTVDHLEKILYKQEGYAIYRIGLHIPSRGVEIYINPYSETTDDRHKIYYNTCLPFFREEKLTTILD